MIFAKMNACGYGSLRSQGRRVERSFVTSPKSVSRSTPSTITATTIVSSLLSVQTSGAAFTDLTAEVGKFLRDARAREGAVTLSERLRTVVETQPFRYEDKVYTITISLGVATTVGDSSMTPASLIRLADEKLYQAKHEGRNLVRS